MLPVYFWDLPEGSFSLTTSFFSLSKQYLSSLSKRSICDFSLPRTRSLYSVTTLLTSVEPSSSFSLPPTSLGLFFNLKQLFAEILPWRKILWVITIWAKSNPQKTQAVVLAQGVICPMIVINLLFVCHKHKWLNEFQGLAWNELNGFPCASITNLAAIRRTICT